MAVYLLLCVPLLYLFVVATAGGGETWLRAADSRYVLVPAVKGALWYAPVFIVILTFEEIVPLRYDPGRLFVYYVVNESALPALLGLGGALLFTRRLRRESDRRINIAMTAVLAGFFTVAAFVDLLRESRYLGPYALVLLPTHRALLMALLPLLLSAWRRESRGIRYLFGAFILITPVLTGLPGFLVSLSYEVGAYGVTAAIGVFAVPAYLLLHSMTFPYRRSHGAHVPAPAAELSEGSEPGSGTGESSARTAAAGSTSDAVE